MKRYISFDVMKGIGIVGVICFHVLNVAFENEADQIKSGNAAIPLLILAVVLVYLGSFNGMFVLLSAIGNIISTHKQWEKLVEVKGMEKKSAAKIIFKNQTIRGAVIWVFGYISEGLLNGLLLDIILGEEDLLKGLYSELVNTNVIQTIGICTIIVSGIYIFCLKNDWDKKKIIELGVILTVIILIMRPFLINYWIPFIDGWVPVIPFLSLAMLGMISGIYLAEGKVTKNFLKWCYMTALLFFVVGVITGLFLGFDFGDDNLPDFCLVVAGEIALSTLLLQLVDYRGKAEKFGKKTTFFRRFNMLLLTIWSFQWITVFPVFIFDAITGWGALQGNLDGFQLLFLEGIVILYWYVIVRIWEKFEFKGTFEWLTIKIFSRGRDDAGDRMKIQEVLYNPESILVREPSS